MSSLRYLHSSLKDRARSDKRKTKFMIFQLFLGQALMNVLNGLLTLKHQTRFRLRPLSNSLIMSFTIIYAYESPSGSSDHQLPGGLVLLSFTSASVPQGHQPSRLAAAEAANASSFAGSAVNAIS